MTTLRLRARKLAVLASFGYALFALGPVAAESSDAAALQMRLAADQSAATALERRLDAAQSRLGETQVADLFGPSDEEKAAAAAAAQHEQAQDSSLATLSQRADALEESLRRLTGQIEVLDHRIGEMNQHIDRVQKDFEYRLCTLSAQQLGASPGADDADSIPCSGGTAAAAPLPTTMPMQQPPPAQDYLQGQPQDPGAPASGPPVQLAPGPGVLGTLPQNGAGNPPDEQAPPAQATQTASLDTHGQFQTAMNMLAHAQYDAASGAFRNFADTYPQDPRAPQALYWFGDIAYVQKDYPSAARAFAEGLKKYPASARAPDSMLKLGQSLIAMNQKHEGCMALRALPEKYPSASNAITQQAEAAGKAGDCRR